MNCPHCDTPVVVFTVPDDLRTHAPDGRAVASLCPHCLSVDSVTGDAADLGADDPDFSRVHESFPEGDGGVAFALLIGTLPSIALNKASARALRERAERDGVDVSLAFDRLVDAVRGADIVPEFNVERRVSQLDSLLNQG